MAEGIESKLYTYSTERSIWNQPLDILQELSIVQLPQWVNVNTVVHWIGCQQSGCLLTKIGQRR